MDLLNHIFEPMESHIYEPNISLISPISLMFNYAKTQILRVIKFCNSNLYYVVQVQPYYLEFYYQPSLETD